MKNTSIRLIAGFAVGLALASPGAAGAPVETPLFEGIGPHTRTVTTSSEDAQRYFNQGLAFLYAFNHDEAIRSFEEAARRDPACAMAWWGIAVANGPHINFPMVPPPRAVAAWEALTKARAHAGQGTSAERALIEALGHRYADPQPEDRAPLDAAYAGAMRKVWHQFPKDADIAALFAEAMMDLRPWDLWTADGQPQPGTGEIIATLEEAMRLDPRHPLANHLYIHTIEASPNPDLADAAADRLRDLQPGMGHNVHMPSHIDVRRGRWHEAILANQKAIAADQRYRERAQFPPDFYRLYMAHNQHMLAFAAMMCGQSELAIRHIRTMVDEIPADFAKTNAEWIDGFIAMPYEVLLRFGRWDEVLAELEPPAHLPFTTAMRHAARGIAHAAKGDVPSARAEQAAYLTARDSVPSSFIVGNNTSAAVLAVATHMLAGEILFGDGKVDEGLAELREAVRHEDLLRYDEPPGWILPVRHALGASLLKAGRFDEAEQVYRDDLARLPENGWSLFGLTEALVRQQKHAAAGDFADRFSDMWAKADVRITSSCFCQPDA